MPYYTRIAVALQYHRPPFGSMLKSAPVWALFIMMVTDSVGYYTLFNCAPLFMNQVLKYNIAEVCILAIVVPQTTRMFRLAQKPTFRHVFGLVNHKKC